MDVAINGETDVMQEKSLQLGGRLAGDEEAFSRVEEPEKSSNDEINGGPVDLTFIGMGGVKGRVEAPDDGHVSRVGSGGGIILVMEALEKSRQQGMVSWSAR